MPILAGSMVTVFGFAALAVDVGFWRYQQRLEQTAADSAAVAGAQELRFSSNPADIVAAARADAATNGFPHDGTVVSVTVNSPPAAGNYAGDPSSVEVIVKKAQPVFFAAASGFSSQTVSARAVAQLTSSDAGCVYALNAAASPYTIQNPAGTLDTGNCAIVDDGSWSAPGGTVSAPSIYVSGGIAGSGGSYTQATPAPALAAPDPCPGLAPCAQMASSPPATSPCTATNATPTGTIYPGVYCGGISINSAAVSMSPGVYVISGGPLSVTGGSLSGSGVTIYVATGGSISLTGGTVNLSAPTSGATAGLLFYQIPGNTNAAAVTASSAATCPTETPNFAGIFYAPSAEVDVLGSGGWDPSTLIAGSIDVMGSTTTCMTPYASTPVIQRAALVE